jgi:hypothetical protein
MPRSVQDLGHRGYNKDVMQGIWWWHDHASDATMARWAVISSMARLNKGGGPRVSPRAKL